MVDIIGYEGYYQVSPDGKIYSVRRGKYLKLNQKKNGYVHVELNKNGVSRTFRVHRIVAQAYIPNPDCKDTINHINCIKNDNRVENLEWATVSENTIHAYNNSLIDIRKHYLLSNGVDLINIFGLETLSDFTGYGSSSLCNYIANGQRLRSGKYKGYVITKI